MIDTDKEIVEVTTDDKISYNPNTKQYGNAAYTVIAVREDDIISEVYLIPEQQPDVEKVYKIIIPGYIDLRSIELMAWTHKGVDDPRHYESRYCEEHGAWEEYWYVPKETFCWRPKFNFGEKLTIIFEKE